MSNELLDPRLPPLVRIVDDDDRVRQSEAFVLRLEGFDVREYSSAEDFLHFDDVSRAGCIVLDIRMPGMNGLELQSELLRTGRSLPILFLTGHGDVAMAVDALKRGAADFIQKPVKAERLAALTHELVAWHQQYTQRLTQRRHAIEKLKALTPKELEVCRLAASGLSMGVIIKTSTPVTTLLTDNDGRVCGVQIAENNIRKNIFSKRGVIVASGGFGANPAMIARYAPQFSGLTTNNMPGSTGEMLLAAQKAGAELVDMEDVLCNPGLPPGRVMRARFHMLVDQFILVDQTGRRFIREDASRAAVTRAILALPGKVAYTIIDSKGMKNLSILMQKEAVLAVESGDAWTADTIEDLARLMKLPAANLQATIDDYNTGMKTGQDPLGKVAPRGDFSLDHPPYWACFAGMSIHYTMGGIRINELAQAMRADGRPVAGLWAAGEATGGIHGKERLGGNGINDAVVFGRIAGQQAARDL